MSRWVISRCHELVEGVTEQLSNKEFGLAGQVTYHPIPLPPAALLAPLVGSIAMTLLLPAACHLFAACPLHPTTRDRLHTTSSVPPSTTCLLQAIYAFMWNDFADWYIEISKSRIAGDDKIAARQARRTLVYVLDNCLRLLHPFMPFLTEEERFQTSHHALHTNDSPTQPMPPPVIQLGRITRCLISGYIASPRFTSPRLTSQSPLHHLTSPRRTSLHPTSPHLTAPWRPHSDHIYATLSTQ